MIDLASDTVTQPTAAMREAMAQAEVGDDVFGEDPTVKALEAQVAELLGKEDALFVPSGSMSNLIAVRLHCQPGDEMLCEIDCHIFRYEQAGYAQLAGVAPQAIRGEGGVLQLRQMVDRIRPANDHVPRTRLLCLENTHNRAAGRIQPYDVVVEICDWAKQHGLARHLDGARLFNAVVATGIPASDWAQHFDTVGVCFSKGLGAPVGSALCGTKDAMRQARRQRKVLGGGMRQAGILAAGAIYALQHHVERLAEDHANASILAEAIRCSAGLSLEPDAVDTNIVIFRVDPTRSSAEGFCNELLTRGVRMLPIDTQLVRAVTHLDVSQSAMQTVAETLAQIVAPAD